MTTALLWRATGLTTVEVVRASRAPRPQCGAPSLHLETTAEVLTGLITAYDHYEQKSEAAWR